jgi:hypothetical protein
MNPPQSPERDDDKPAILYLRTGILVRDPVRAQAETTPLARELASILSLSGLAAIVGSLLGLLLR